MTETPTKRRCPWFESNPNSLVAVPEEPAKSAINGSKARQPPLADGLTLTNTWPVRAKFLEPQRLKSSFQARGGLGDTLMPNRMTAATHSHVSQGYLRPRGRRGVLGVVCPNLREIRLIGEPWWNLEVRDLLLVATNTKLWRNVTDPQS